jgi:hypothetical protein
MPRQFEDAMTEAEWLASTEPGPMLEFVRGKATDRQLILYNVAICRRIWRFISDTRLQKGVETAERFAEGTATNKECSETITDLRKVPQSGFSVLMAPPHSSVQAFGPARGAATSTALGHLDMIRVAAGVARSALAAGIFLSGDLDPNDLDNAWKLGWAAEQRTQACLLREILGPLPFRQLRFQVPVPMRVIRLAKSIYDERPMPQGTLVVGRLLMLADALLECGCRDEEVQAHCRSEGPHVRGCWAVDLILEQRRRLGGRLSRRISH